MEKNSDMTFAYRLKILRIMRGVTQQQLAKTVDIPVGMLSYIETGKILPTSDWENRIKMALDWPEDTVFASLLA